MGQRGRPRHRPAQPPSQERAGGPDPVQVHQGGARRDEAVQPHPLHGQGQGLQRQVGHSDFLNSKVSNYIHICPGTRMRTAPRKAPGRTLGMDTMELDMGSMELGMSFFVQGPEDWEF